MYLRIGLMMEVEAEHDDEEAGAQEFREQMERDGVLDPGWKTDVTLDESLFRDFLRIVEQLGELKRRAAARKAKRK